MDSPKDDWPALADRFVTAVEKIADAYDFDEVPDPSVGQLELIMSIHAEYHDCLETYLGMEDALKKYAGLRRLSADAKNRSLQAQQRLESMHGKET